MATTSEPPLLLLHFDINKTLIMDDPAAAVRTSGMINQLIASSAFGSYVVDRHTSSWVLGSPVLCTTPPAPGLVSYASFLRYTLYPYREDSPADAAGRVAKVEFNRRQKSLAKDATMSFTEHGQPGASFRPLYELLEAELSLSPAARAACQEVPGAPAAWLRGTHFILPCYFRLLSALLSRGRRFAIIFRTFGSDLAEVVWEHNLFCAGRHPLHALPTGTSPEAAAALCVSMPDDTGRFIRHGLTADGTHLAVVMGRHPHARVCSLTGFRAIHDYLVAAVDVNRNAAAAGDAAASSPTESQEAAPAVPPSAHVRALAFQDDFSFWFAHHEMGSAGKLLTLDPSDTSTHALFVDDNVGANKDSLRLLSAAVLDRLASEGISVQGGGEGCSSACLPGEDTGIVDVRDVRTGDAIPFEVARNAVLIRADPLSAILHDGYLVDLVAYAERGWRELVSTRR